MIKTARKEEEVAHESGEPARKEKKVARKSTSARKEEKIAHEIGEPARKSTPVHKQTSNPTTYSFFATISISIYTIYNR